MNCNKTIGEKAEETATGWLIKKGYTIIERNWRHKHWEIDIIASKENKLHFVEVKSRSTVRYGYPEAAIGHQKLLALKNGIEEYLLLYPEWSIIQIDVLTVVWKLGRVQELLMIEDVY
ncbi:MAG TPA: YraN family protein [Chitinophagaceae bacterium]|nr:YraN family protein [Chitinophagaceae bacterium]